MKTHRAYCDTCGRAFAWRGSPQTRRGRCPECFGPLETYGLAPARTPIEPISPPEVARTVWRGRLGAILRGD